MIAWHCATVDRSGRPCLGYGDGRAIVPGESLRSPVPPAAGTAGLHASESLLDAVGFGHGAVVCRVRLDGAVHFGAGEVAAEGRTCLWLVDAVDLLLDWARDWTGTDWREVLADLPRRHKLAAGAGQWTAAHVDGDRRALAHTDLLGRVLRLSPDRGAGWPLVTVWPGAGIGGAP